MSVQSVNDIATIALGLGWTMNQVREHTWRDINAMGEAKKVQARKQRVAALQRKR